MTALLSNESNSVIEDEIEKASYDLGMIFPSLLEEKEPKFLNFER